MFFVCIELEPSALELYIFDPKIVWIWSSVRLDQWLPIQDNDYSSQQYLLNLILQSCGITE